MLPPDTVMYVTNYLMHGKQVAVHHNTIYKYDVELNT